MVLSMRNTLVLMRTAVAVLELSLAATFLVAAQPPGQAVGGVGDVSRFVSVG